MARVGLPPLGLTREFIGGSRGHRGITTPAGTRGVQKFLPWASVHLDP